jgi:hypothetical protein
VVSVETGARPVGAAGPTLATLDAEARRLASEGARKQVEKHPLVADVMRIFGAELREVRLPDREE